MFLRKKRNSNSTDNTENENIKDYPIRLIGFSKEDIYTSMIIIYEDEENRARRKIIEICHGVEFLDFISFTDEEYPKIIFEYNGEEEISCNLIMPRKYMLKIL